MTRVSATATAHAESGRPGADDAGAGAPVLDGSMFAALLEGAVPAALISSGDGQGEGRERPSGHEAPGGAGQHGARTDGSTQHGDTGGSATGTPDGAATALAGMILASPGQALAAVTFTTGAAPAKTAAIAPPGHSSRATVTTGDSAGSAGPARTRPSLLAEPGAPAAGTLAHLGSASDGAPAARAAGSGSEAQRAGAARSAAAGAIGPSTASLLRVTSGADPASGLEDSSADGRSFLSAAGASGPSRQATRNESAAGAGSAGAPSVATAEAARPAVTSAGATLSPAAPAPSLPARIAGAAPSLPAAAAGTLAQGITVLRAADTPGAARAAAPGAGDAATPGAGAAATLSPAARAVAAAAPAADPLSPSASVSAGGLVAIGAPPTDRAALQPTGNPARASDPPAGDAPQALADAGTSGSITGLDAQLDAASAGGQLGLAEQALPSVPNGPGGSSVPAIGHIVDRYAAADPAHAGGRSALGASAGGAAALHTHDQATPGTQLAPSGSPAAAPGPALAATGLAPATYATVSSGAATTASVRQSPLDHLSLAAAISQPVEGSDGSWSLSARLDPPQLGSVQASVHVDGDSVRVVLTPASDAGHQALAASLDHLADELARTGRAVELTLAPPSHQAGTSAGGDHGAGHHPEEQRAAAGAGGGSSPGSGGSGQTDKEGAPAEASQPLQDLPPTPTGGDAAGPPATNAASAVQSGGDHGADADRGHLDLLL